MKIRPHPLTMTARHRTPRVWNCASVVLMAVLTGLCLSGWQKTAALNTQIGTLQEQKEELHFLLERQQQAQPQNTGVKSAELEKIRQRLSAPWQPLLAALNKAALPAVSLMAVSPDAESQKVQLTVAAQTLEQTLQYINKLEASATLSNVHLASQQPIAPTTLGLTAMRSALDGKTRFVLKADWRHP